MTPDLDSVENLPIKSQFSKWLFSQGASTVLLCGILIFLGYCAVKIYPEIRADQKEEASRTRTEFGVMLKQARDDQTAADKERYETLGKSIDRLTDQLLQTNRNK